MRRFLAITTVAGLAVSGAFASNVINEHSGYYVEDVHYTIVSVAGNDVAVRINKDSVSTQLWKFEAYDSVTDEPGYIDYIIIDPTGETVGPIKLSIVGASGHTYGAEDIGEINLTDNADATTEIVDITISGDLATDDDVSCHYITGTVDIGADVDGHDINILNDVDGEIAIGDLLDGSIYVGGSLNALTVPRWWADPYNTIVVDGDVGEISIPNECANNIFIADPVLIFVMALTFFVHSS